MAGGAQVWQWGRYAVMGLVVVMQVVWVAGRWGGRQPGPHR